MIRDGVRARAVPLQVVQVRQRTPIEDSRFQTPVSPVRYWVSWECLLWLAFLAGVSVLFAFQLRLRFRLDDLEVRFLFLKRARRITRNSFAGSPASKSALRRALAAKK